ncbi:MAG: single-stranded DNA-binding protein [bacterium]|nr:single-stranded DNA-binding protein [bacterium]
MAINLNRVEVIGNLTRDPELRYTPNGRAVASFAVATNRRWQDQQGNWVDADPEYHDVVVWAKLAEGVNRTLKKGDRVFVNGRLQTQSWEGQDGNKRTRTEIVADTVIGPDQVMRAGNEPGNGPTVGSAAPSFAPTPTATPTSAPTAAPSSAPASAPAAPASVPAPASAPSDDEINIEDIPF